MNFKERYPHQLSTKQRYCGLTVTKRQKELLINLKTCYTLRALADKMGLDYKTVKFHITNIVNQNNLQGEDCKRLILSSQVLGFDRILKHPRFIEYLRSRGLSELVISTVIERFKFHTTQQIADKHFVSNKAVKERMTKVYKRMRVKSIFHLMVVLYTRLWPEIKNTYPKQLTSLSHLPKQRASDSNFLPRGV